MKDGQTAKKTQEFHSESYFGGAKNSSEKDYGGSSNSRCVTASHIPQEVREISSHNCDAMQLFVSIEEEGNKLFQGSFDTCKPICTTCTHVDTLVSI